MTYLSLIMDIVLAGLLVATIVYASVLNRKLATLRSAKQEMETLASRLVDSTQHAERALADLKSAANDTGEQLERRVSEARSLVDDLRFLVDKGNGLADRLATDIDKSRRSAGSGAGSSSVKAGGEGQSGAAGGRPKTGGDKRRTAKSAASEKRWDDEENAPDADPQLLQALRQIR